MRLLRSFAITVLSVSILAGCTLQLPNLAPVSTITPQSPTSTNTPTGTPTTTALPTMVAMPTMMAAAVTATAPIAQEIGAAGGIVPVAPAVAATQAPPIPVIAATPADMFFENYGVNPFLDTQDDHLSTFAMDVDTASYTLARSYLLDQHQFPPADAIRPEEFINYFDVGYQGPSDSDNSAFAIHLDAAPAPFGFIGHKLMRVGIQGRYVSPDARPATQLIFVIDVSGSMGQQNRLELVKETLALLVNALRPDDSIGIIVFSDNSRAVLDVTPVKEKDTILSAIQSLHTEGATNAEAGLILGYQMAQQHLRQDAMTRIILCSDGVANVGNTGPETILKTIRANVANKITLTTVGFGMGNYNDVLMEQLANDGDGNYFYVDNLREARRIFVYNLTSTLQVIAYDAKVQVDFNPAVTDRYRLIGYENRAVADQDFRNDKVDAGEVGAGHSVTALYELALQDGMLKPDEVIATVYVRYQDATSKQVVEISRPITVGQLLGDIEQAPAGFRLQAAVAEFSELLRHSYWAQDGSYGAVHKLAEPLIEELPNNPEVAEFVKLVEAAMRYTDK